MVELAINITNKGALREQITTLPSGYRPYSQIFGKGVGGSLSDSVSIEVNTDGSVYTTGVNNYCFCHIVFGIA